MEERWVFVDPSEDAAWCSGLLELGIETDTEFRVNAPSGLVLLHVRGMANAIAQLSTVQGYCGSTDRLA